MHRLTLIVLLGCGGLMASCASQPLTSPAAPRVEMPAEALRPCAIYLLPAEPTQADLEIGYAERGAQIASCNAARNLAVQTHSAEHELEDRLGAKPSRR
jgi:hypothetical protein